MQVALIAQWCRVSVQDPILHLARAYVRWVSCAQLGWVTLAVLDVALPPTVAVAMAMLTVGFTGPVVAERRGKGSSWHPNHIAERYGLLAIIGLGEGIFGTVTTVSVMLDRQGWKIEPITVVIAGIGLTFGMWWTYFILPSGTLLTHRCNKWSGWGYGHILVYASIAAMGAGLHVAALVVEGVTSISTVGAILAVSIPVRMCLFAQFELYRHRVHGWLVLIIGMVVVLVAAIRLAAAGASIGLCLIVVTLSPTVVAVRF